MILPLSTWYHFSVFYGVTLLHTLEEPHNNGIFHLDRLKVWYCPWAHNITFLSFVVWSYFLHWKNHTRMGSSTLIELNCGIALEHMIISFFRSFMVWAHFLWLNHDTDWMLFSIQQFSLRGPSKCNKIKKHDIWGYKAKIQVPLFVY